MNVSVDIHMQRKDKCKNRAYIKYRLYAISKVGSTI